MSVIDDLKNGDIASLAILVKDYKQICIGYLINKTNCNLDDAEDIFTEVIVDFGEKVVAGKVVDISNINGYLSRACYNLWLNLFRKNKKESENTSEVERYFYDYMEPDIIEEPSSWKEQLFDVSEKAFQTLSENCKQLINYFYLEERSMTEIAKIMGHASAEVARATKYKCFKKLKESATLLHQKTI